VPIAEINNVEMWRLRELVEYLEGARGDGTSMVSLVLPPGEKLALTIRRLSEEQGTASNTKNRVNRQSVLAAISSTLA
jgi:peptide chain release factor subunit 1